eukprot:1983692-Pleurochrysis_carterae.AAC.1
MPISATLYRQVRTLTKRRCSQGHAAAAAAASRDVAVRCLAAGRSPCPRGTGPAWLRQRLDAQRARWARAVQKGAVKGSAVWRETGAPRRQTGAPRREMSARRQGDVKRGAAKRGPSGSMEQIAAYTTSLQDVPRRTDAEAVTRPAAVSSEAASSRAAARAAGDPQWELGAARAASLAARAA